MSNISIVIMAGGSGTRFWPLSRISRPKQCLSIFSDKSMNQDTVNRLKLLSNNISIVTVENVAQPIKKLVQYVKYIIEPMPRNTAPAIGLAAIHADPNDIIVIETADHVYKDVDAYINNLKKSIQWAEKDYIVQIGIKPTYPETGYGYIEQGALLDKSEIKVYKIDSFREKPNLATAERYIESGDFLWNSGLYIFRAAIMLKEMKRYMPKLYEGLMKIKESNYDKNTIHEVFKTLPEEECTSIDFGITERTTRNVMIRGEFHWDDIGDLKAFERFFEKDENDNLIKTPYVGIDSKNNIILSDNKKRLITTADINNKIIVSTEDCVFICPIDKAQEAKKIVKELRKRGMEEYL